MLNKYGYFKYSDFAIGAKETAIYTSNAELQEGSSLTHLSVGVEPHEYASIEQDAYVTAAPKKLYKTGNLGFVTKQISNKDGFFSDTLVLTVNFPRYFSMSGITINSRNIIESLTITAYRDYNLIDVNTFSASSKDYFYNFPVEFINKLVFTFSKIDKPYHFLGVYNIEFGRIRIFDDKKIINAEINNYFSVLGDSLQYDTLDLSIIRADDEDYLFQRKQPVDYMLGDVSKYRFYIDKGEEEDESTISLTAYDDIANLEDNFFGGMYNEYPLADLIGDILNGTDVKYTVNGIDGINVTGYLPIASRRKALQTILQGTNIRCYKAETLVFKPITSELNSIVFDESNIVAKPKKTKKQEIRSVKVNQHNYSKGTEESEIYHWYMSTTENITITFSNPMHSLKAYEVIGVDENDQDIISETESENVQFIEQGVNYAIISNSSSNKIVIVGKNYIDSIVSYEKRNPLIIANEIYDEIVVDLTITNNAQAVCNLLYDLHSRKNSIVFKTIQKPEIGEYYNILGDNLHIKRIEYGLSGVYEVEAV